MTIFEPGCRDGSRVFLLRKSLPANGFRFRRRCPNWVGGSPKQVQVATRSLSANGMDYRFSPLLRAFLELLYHLSRREF